MYEAEQWRDGQRGLSEIFSAMKTLANDKVSARNRKTLERVNPAQ